jgi:hypothetical protein
VKEDDVLRHPAITAIVAVALNVMFEAIPGSSAVDCMMAEWKGTGLEAP